jgi:uncharacterized protein YndB with AHSA1/START domain
MDIGTIQREIYIEASPEVVFDVVSRPEHVQRWWPDEARYEAVPGATGEIVFGDPAAGGGAVAFSVLEVDPPRTFSFRWTHPFDEPAVAGNSLLVTFELVPTGTGTRLTMTETGFREMGWDEARTQAEYDDHVAGWDHFLARIAPYVATLGVGA